MLAEENAKILRRKIPEGYSYIHAISLKDSDACQPVSLSAQAYENASQRSWFAAQSSDFCNGPGCSMRLTTGLMLIQIVPYCSIKYFVIRWYPSASSSNQGHDTRDN
jgi:hypothetical protein